MPSTLIASQGQSDAAFFERGYVERLKARQVKAVWIGVVCAFLTGVVAFCGLTLATVGTVAEAEGSFEGKWSR